MKTWKKQLRKTLEDRKTSRAHGSEESVCENGHLYNTVYSSNELPIKVPKPFSRNFLMLKFMTVKKILDHQIILSKKNSTLLNLSPSLIVVTKIACSCHKNRHIDQCRRTKAAGKSSHSHRHFIFFLQKYQKLSLDSCTLKNKAKLLPFPLYKTQPLNVQKWCEG